MKILCVGGGSGGHIAPIVAVVEQLRQSANIRKMGGEPEIRVWCDRNFFAQAKQMFGDNSVRIETISAGKLRRYANLGFLYRWFSPWHIIHTHIPNLIDMGRVLVGLVQSLVKLAVWRPDVVFCKGG